MSIEREAGARARLLTGAVSGLALMVSMGGMAHAQTAPAAAAAEEPDEVVVVTGIRRGIEDAIAVKRDLDVIAEVVSAEDIGKLPDVSIAESLGRLPGLALQRLDGRGQVLSIRGLGPDYTGALLNGREQVSTGDNRGVEFDQFPSELLSSVIVYKTPAASSIAQGIAGTADLRTVRPLAFGRRAIALSARYEWNEIGALNAGTTDNGNRFSVSYIDQNEDGTLGIALGFAHMESPYQSQRFNAWGYPNLNANNLVIGGSKSYVQSSNLTRDGFMGVLEYRPSDTFHTTIDAYYSQFDNYQILRGIELPLQWSAAQLQPGFTTADGFVTSGTFNNVKGVMRNDVNLRDATNFSFGWNTVWNIGDNWEVTLDLSHSSVDRTDVILETYSGTGRDGVGATDNISFRQTSDYEFLFSGILNYADPNLIRLTSPQGWGGNVVPGGQVGYYNQPTVEDEINAIRLSAEVQMDNFLSSIEFGVNVSERSKSLVANEFFLDLAGASGQSIPIPSNAIRGSTNLTFLSGQPMISYDPLALLDQGVYALIRNPNGDVANKNWEVDETVILGYVQANIDTQIGSMPLTGNIGLQVVNTDQSGSGTSVSSTGSGFVGIPVTESANYTEVLPAMNLILEVADQNFLRFSVGRTLSRARMDDMRGGSTWNYNAALAASTNINNSPWSGNGGNPQLRPRLATGIDLAYERYFGRRGYFAIAGYYKDIESWVWPDAPRLFDFTGFPASPTPVLRTGLMFTPENTGGGYIQGFEATVNLPLDILHESLEGFGIIISGATNESEIQREPNAAPVPVPGLSETTGNLTVYYERNGIQVRLSNRYRDDFVGEVSGFGNGRTLRWVAAESILDAQVGYQFQSGLLEGLSVTLQANNLTDEPFVTWEGNDPRQVRDFQRYGASYLLGVNYRF